MGLKQDIVLVNEYTVPLPGGKGSRGGTPGAYVERYMAREQAVESLAPIRRLRTDDFIMRYMARESAVEKASLLPSHQGRRMIKHEMRQAQGNGGVAFGYGSVSLSDDQLKGASSDIQRLFEQGHTVMKTVLSFDEKYLKKHGLVDEDFELTGRGGYRGHVDQMKLRMAIMHGLDRMGTAGFDDLRYVGVIQVDTEHVHCHLALTDAGRGQVTKDGTQRGKLLDKHKSRLRRGIDAWLDEKQAVKHLSSAVGYERRNVTTYIKRWAHERMASESLPQFLIACLPEDRSLWRAGTNDKRMRKANELVTELVEEQLARPDSPMPAAMEKIIDYANHRRSDEGLDMTTWQKLVDHGRRQIVERGVNGVYQMLKSLPEDELRVRTPMLDVMSMDYEQMALRAADEQQTHPDEEDSFVAFGFRLRSYASRLEHHRKQASLYRNRARDWEKADAAGAAAEESRPLYEFYRFEEQYQLQLASKYQHFLPFAGDASAWYEEHTRVADYGKRLVSLMALRGDSSLQRMKDGDEAERLGREIYGQPGGRLLTEGSGGRMVLDHRIDQMRKNYEDQLQALREDLALSGLVLRAESESERVQATGAQQDGTRQTDMLPAGRDSGGPGKSPGRDADPALEPTVIEQGTAYSFDEVKALDLHHLGLDFFNDVEIGKHSHDAFVSTARRRRELLLGAVQYLERSNQSEAIGQLPIDDVALMTRTRRRMTDERKATGKSTLHSRFAELRAQRAEEEKVRRQAATSLDAGLAVRVRGQVDEIAVEAARHPELLALNEHEWEPDGAEPDRERE